ncbi:Gfo/Idh/MocA family oxidoreductase [Paenibacillus sp. J5C_2022]|uniref:Gfo/Idh/MocA family protein n=1 Tax=Paenibacillus sp. J5C2022 TaxID=2977129 RepID=UPI0021CDF225|nr:Gfo/Idh/MocA family oxidoreductase [Paenibacillus sp. J5C2022]MCU6712079.1 Gfo/Idh/MocA family oxidoreductase [Paenibacillus sp. J5C2022]
MKTIRWGIIGCGNVTEHKSGPAFQKASHSSLTAVMRRNGELAKDYAERHGVPKWYDSAEALIHDDEVDAVYIATPPSSHKPYAIAAARAGKPVYVEKPMSVNTSDCEEMLHACKASQVPLYVAYYRRALPDFIKIKSMLEQKVIGEVRFVRTVHYMANNINDSNMWRVAPDIAGGGLFVDVGSHTLDILDYLLGPIKEVKGFAANMAGAYEAEDTVTMSYRFASDVQGTGTWCFCACGSEEYNEIVGTEGRILFSTYGNRLVRVETGKGVQELAFTYPEHIQQHLIQSIVDELRGVGSCPSHGESALRTNWVMEQVLHTYARMF